MDSKRVLGVAYGSVNAHRNVLMFQFDIGNADASPTGAYPRDSIA